MHSRLDCFSCAQLSLASLSRSPKTRRSLPLLTNIAQIKQLRETEATRGYPVCVRGIVTFQNAVRDAVIHDSNDGIFVARTNATFDLVQGQLVEVRGMTGLAGYAPRVEAHQIRVLGQGSCPRRAIFPSIG